jgi:hypothetical protein
MEVFADTIILLFWLLFFTATFLGVYDEYRRNQSKRAHLASSSRLNDDDPVYLMETSLRD